MRWIQRIARDDKNTALIFDAMDHFAAELVEGRKLLNVHGTKIMSKLQNIPAEIEYHFRNSQEVEQILEFVEKMEQRMIVDKTKMYTEHYQRVLSDAVARRYAEAHEDVATIYNLKVEVAMVRNDYLGLYKALEAFSFKLKEIVELHKNALEDAVFTAPDRD